MWYGRRGITSRYSGRFAVVARGGGRRGVRGRLRRLGNLSRLRLGRLGKRRLWLRRLSRCSCDLVQIFH